MSAKPLQPHNRYTVQAREVVERLAINVKRIKLLQVAHFLPVIGQALEELEELVLQARTDMLD